MARIEAAICHCVANGRAKLQFALKMLFVACILAAGLLIVWGVFFRSAARICRLAPGEKLAGSCLTVGCMDEPRRCEAIFRVDGMLSVHNDVLATLYAVQKGNVQQVSSITVGIPMRPTADLLPSDFGVQFALCEHDDPLPPALMLGVAGRKRAAGSGSFLPARRCTTNARVFSGPVPTGRAAIAYVEGSSSVVHPMMTVASFAETNRTGDYIVVTVQMVSASGCYSASLPRRAAPVL